MLAALGMQVVAVDPARASLDVARGKPGRRAGRAAWTQGTTVDLPEVSADLAVMTANVAQVFLTDEEWMETLVAVRRRLRQGGVLAFETRDPQQRAWERWTPELSRLTVDVPDVGRVWSWEEVRRVELPLVTFDEHTLFHNPDGPDEDVVSTSTLRFRTSDEVRASVRSAGYERVETQRPVLPAGKGLGVRRLSMSVMRLPRKLKTLIPADAGRAPRHGDRWPSSCPHHYYEERTSSARPTSRA